jgi:hypothetical protein
MTTADLADYVVAALEALGGEAQRKDVIDLAVDLGGWSAEERAVVSWYTGAARHFHLRTLADYAVTVCRDRGQIEPGAARGRWRLVASAGEVTPHPFGRVFTAAVGLAGNPVGDEWRAHEHAEEHGHIWFSGVSRQLGSGDHLFAIGVNRDRAVLGLFEVQSAGDLTRPRNPWEPDRWPYAVAVRALASVPPTEATNVPGVTTPRQTAIRIRDPVQQGQLYAAVAGRGVAGSPAEEQREGASLGQRAAAMRSSRPFNPERAPTPRRSGDGVLDLEEIEARQEKASQGHHALLVRLHEHLVDAGWTDLQEIPAAIDLMGRAPAGEVVIFEAKTISNGNETRQCRNALAQLIEYRQEYGRPDDALCVVVDAAISATRTGILERLGVAVVLAAQAEEFGWLNECGRAVAFAASDSY